ncbi:hypothetical protein LB504_009374 [Fusarium proliferatum]|nr:hypothetical protein LB504_009374 [Fusarium proliferatum]
MGHGAELGKGRGAIPYQVDLGWYFDVMTLLSGRTLRGSILFSVLPWIWLVLALDSNVFSSRILRCSASWRLVIGRGRHPDSKIPHTSYWTSWTSWTLINHLANTFPLDQGMDPLPEDVCFCLDLFLLKQCFALDPMTWTTYLSRGLLIRH